MRISLLLGAALLIAPTASTSQSPATVEVHLSNFRFTPKPIQLEHGRPYVLRLVNDSGGGHNFAAPAFFASAAIAPADRARLRNGKVEVPARQIREIRLVAPGAGSYPLKCTHFMHGAFGMKSAIIVRQAPPAP